MIDDSLGAALQVFKMTKEPGYVEPYNIFKPINDRLGQIMLDEIDVDTILGGN